MLDFDIQSLPTPCYVLDKILLKKNLEILKYVEEKTNCHILLAQKAFSMYAVYPMISEYLSGTTASSLFEAKLGKEEMGKEVHIFAAAYREDEINEILKTCDHIVFNSLEQWTRYKDLVFEYKKKKKLECGLRINPEYSEIDVDLYNPCSPNSRFGITIDQLKDADLSGVDGLHFHAMCEQQVDVLERVLEHVEEKFAPYLHQMKWINFGGGHHITKPNYDLELLIRLVNRVKETYGVQVYLEPGEAIACDTGYLVTEVLELMKNGMNLAILDTTAACHMPDVLEMPYRPEVIGSYNPEELSQKERKEKYVYRFGGPTCLSGDVIGDYAFDEPLHVKQRLVFTDMMIYSMVKNNTFNGINLPAIAIVDEKRKIKILKQFGYDDFKRRL